MRKNSSKKGFTLVELSLSIAFIAILSITIALIINDAISTYRRGLTLNQINTTGMDLVDDIRTAVQNSPATPPIDKCGNYESGEDNFQKNCEKDSGAKLMNVTKTGEVEGVGEDAPLYGAFCTGAYSYIWNSGYLFLGKSGDKATYAVYEGDKAVCRVSEAWYGNGELHLEMMDLFDGHKKDIVLTRVKEDEVPLAEGEFRCSCGYRGKLSRFCPNCGRKID